jgi:hypothetical protein
VPVGTGGTLSEAVTNSAGNLIGTYTVFSDGVTARPTGSVEIDRFIDNGSSFIPGTVGGSAFNGAGGLGSEVGTIGYNGFGFTLSNQVEPVLPAPITTVPPTPAPNPPDPTTAEVTEIYREVLARNPDPAGLSTYTQEVANGTSIAQVRQMIALSPEAQNDLNGLYHQIFDRAIDPSGDGTYTSFLANGGSLNAVEVMLAQSPETQNNLNQIYQQVLGRNIDPSGLNTYETALAGGTSLDQAQGLIAHSAEAVADLTSLFDGIVGRAPGIAELLGMEDHLATPGSSQQALASNLSTIGSAGGYTLITADVGSTTLTALPATPTLFTFDDIAFGNDTIAGFDTTRDTIQLSPTKASSFADLQSKMTIVNGGTLITFDPTHSIQINGVAPTNLGPNNFVIA